MEVHAKARYLRMSPRKVRLIIDVVRGIPVTQARIQLKHLKKHAAIPVLKLVESAIANAKHNFGLSEDSLYIKTIMADGGPVLHRWRARAFGRAAPIRKRTTHITVVLDEMAEKESKAIKTAENKIKIRKASVKEQVKKEN
ncbi:MAG: 50S ribosomal protein L22 [Candidatus Uhrbacteria bacterium GW2011_GWE2_40_58]|nr:MAG: 50S ribosomal protein L22 [Candidatus Uhrbacteria bacterium GW2011_GWF2_40_263]KKR67513.1 MAG: 50S ribosomal protein L22 [Candidatus Uhrbacteria bacterium GW2011_GWE2_40_58]OGL93702.1 MAG: 50S ribosomal protein L22 [Candidatus Uhrbacteria bacterium RIFOXYA2_FULL_40_9]OGL96439.1 MAG: 50S ribosomal protein L22 [Candidatus Uhrbacteria bacterium RIFOXYB2_FULL_41_18]HBK34847.1 50S ribosomal protein L22 [Candidatus Uhrbacteria bacterium]